MLAHLTNILKLDNETLGKAARMIISVFAAFGLFYMTSGWIVEPLAKDIFKKMLVAQGVNPEVFIQLQAQSSDNSQDIDELKRDSNAIQVEVGKVQRNLEKVSDGIETQTKSIDKVEDMLGGLIRLQLQRSGANP